MRRERSWESLQPILTARQVCIRPNGANEQRARTDFKNGLVRYYSFPLEGTDSFGTGDHALAIPKRGYVRFIEDRLDQALLLDFISPYGEKKAWEEITEFADRVGPRAHILVPNGNFNANVKPLLTEWGEVDLAQITQGIHHKVYCMGEKSMFKLK